MTNRRTFIKTTALAPLSVDPVFTFLGKLIKSYSSNQVHQFSIIRYQDLMLLHYIYVGFNKVDKSNNPFSLPPQSHFKPVDKDSRIVILLPPQHIAEEAFFSPGKFPTDLNNRTANSFLSGNSYLVFRLKENVDAIGFNSNEIIDFGSLELETKTPTNYINLNDLIKNGSLPDPKKVKNLFTQFEYPYKTFISPVTKKYTINNKEYFSKFVFEYPQNKLLTLFNRKIGDSFFQINPLWHNSIFEVLGDNSEELLSSPTLKMVDYYKKDEFDRDNNEHGIIPSENHRAELIKGINQDNLIQSSNFTPSSLGISAKVWYENNEHPALSNWKQETTLGRDNLALITIIVIDTEFGIQFKITEISKRKFLNGYSYLDKRYYIEKYDDEINFSYTNKHGREYKIVYPDFTGKIFIKPLDITTCKSVPSSEGFITTCKLWTSRNRNPFTCVYESVSKDGNLENLFEFPFIGIDHDGKKHSLSVPLIFTESTPDINRFKSDLKKTINFKRKHFSRYKIFYNKEKITYAKTATSVNYPVKNDENKVRKVNNGLLTTHYTFSIPEMMPAADYTKEKPLISKLYYASVTIDAIENIKSGTKNNITFYKNYYDKNESENNLKIFAQILNNEIEIIDDAKFKSDPLSHALAIKGIFNHEYGKYTQVVKPSINIGYISLLEIGITANHDINGPYSRVKRNGGKKLFNASQTLTGSLPNILGYVDLKLILAMLDLDDLPSFKIIDSAKTIIDSINDVKGAINKFLSDLGNLNLNNTSINSLKAQWENLTTDAERVKTESREIKKELRNFQDFYNQIDSTIRKNISKLESALSLNNLNHQKFKDYYSNRFHDSRLISSKTLSYRNALDNIDDSNSEDEFEILLMEIKFRDALRELIALTPADKENDSRKIIFSNLKYSILAKDKTPLQEDQRKKIVAQSKVLNRVIIETKKLIKDDTVFELAEEMFGNVKTPEEKLQIPDYFDSGIEAWIKTKSILDFIFDQYQYFSKLQAMDSAEFKAKFESIYNNIKSTTNKTRIEKGISILNSKDSTHGSFDEIIPDYNNAFFGSKEAFDKKFGNFFSAYNEYLLLQTAGANLYKEYRSEVLNQLKSFDQVSKEIGDFFQELEQTVKNEIGVLKQNILANKDISNAIQTIKSLKVLLTRLEKLRNPKIEHTWRTESFQSRRIGPINFHANVKGNTYLNSRATLGTQLKFENSSLQIGEPQLSSYNEIGNFGITFFKAIRIDFERVTITAGNNVKDDVDIKIRDVEFLGILKFVSALQEYFESVTKVLDFDISASGIRMSYLFPLPDINAGVIYFYNLKFSLGLKIPFKANTPIQLVFGINTRTAPFKIIAYGFPGKGHFVIIMEAKKGIIGLDIQIEFGKTAQFNFGIAQGELHFKAGFYFRKLYDDVKFKGYVIAGGSIRIAGIFNFSIYFHLILVYDNGHLYGEAVLVFKKKIGFVKIKYYVRIYMEFQSPKKQNQVQGSGNKTLLAQQDNFYLLDGRQDQLELHEQVRLKQLKGIRNKSFTEKAQDKTINSFRRNVQNEQIIQEEKNPELKTIQNYTYEKYYSSYFQN